MTNQVGSEDLRKSSGNRNNSIAIVTIIAITIVILVCILACSATAIICIYNISW